jgi:CRISPR-associated protein Cmr1
MIIKFRPLTEIWTGVDSRQNSLRLTGLLGSIRWWSEALVRSFGVYVCNPQIHACENYETRCVICRLFGNAGAKDNRDRSIAESAKFALRCWNESAAHPGQPDRTQVRTAVLGPIGKNDPAVCLEFLFLRQPDPHEELLLAKTLDIIGCYGSIGGRTVRKPTWAKDPRGVHKDYGLIAIDTIGEWESRWSDGKMINASDFSQFQSLIMAAPPNLQVESDGLPNLNLFWFVPGKTLFVHPNDSLNKKSINELLGLQDSTIHQFVPDIRKAISDDDAQFDQVRAHFRGAPEPGNKTTSADQKRLKDQGMTEPRSKRVFSFKQPARTWGYVLDRSLWGKEEKSALVEALLKTVDINPSEIHWGCEVKALELQKFQAATSARL